MKLINFVTVFGLCLSQHANAAKIDKEVYEVIISHEDGETSILNIAPDETFLDVMQKAESLCQNENSVEDEFIKPYKKEFFLHYNSEHQPVLSIAKSSNSQPRNYEAKVTSKEKEDISFIVTTLGRGSLKKLLTEKSALKKAGSRVDHVHPLRFIGCIFSDEEMKVGILQVKERGGWVAKEFFNGMYESLTTESGLQNLKVEYINDFANSLSIDPNLIIKPIQDKNWKGFINILIEVIPRSGNPNRYDM